MTRVFTLCLLIASSFVSLSAQSAPPPAERLLVRRYVDGQALPYLMKGKNNNWTYEVRITGTVRKDATGRFVDEFAWSSLVSDGESRVLAPATQALRVAFTLEGSAPFDMPNLANARQIIGPVTDLLTFYADLFLAMHMGSLKNPGDHMRFDAGSVPSSWAAGPVIIGEDSIDFDITLTNIDAARRVATLLVKHVPPVAPKIRIPAEWMRPPVADTPNNWVQVRKTATGYDASIGKETFDVTLTVDLSDGKILAARMENPVTAITRACSDEALTQCGDPRPDPTLRQIEMTLLRE